MKIVVTGGAGFIGSHIVDALIARAHEVICLDSLDPGIYRGVPAYLNPGADYCFADLRTWRPDGRFEGTESVVHFAALGGVSRASREPANLLQANVGGTAQLLAAMSEWTDLRKVIIASSFSVYGAAYEYECPECGGRRRGQRDAADMAAGRYEVRCIACGCNGRITPLDESAAPEPLELYGASKYMQELVFTGFERCPVHILRQSSVYGSRLRLDDGEATIIAQLAGCLRAGRRPKLFEDGHQIRDWVHVSDSVAAVLALLDEEGGPPVVNVCTGVATTLLEACRDLAEAMGVDVEPEVVGGYRPGDMRHCLGDPGLLTKLIDRLPVPFSEGCRRTFGPASPLGA